MSAYDKLRSFAEAREHDSTVIRSGLTYGDAREAAAEIARLRRERDEAQANYRWMVEHAADQRLDGYRELGQRAAVAETERDEARAEIARLRAEAGDYLRPDVRQAARMAMEERGRLRSELRATEKQMEVFREERDAARAEIARIESHYREAIKAGDWARAEATEAKGRAVVAETHLRKARAALSRHTCQHAECSDPETHAGCHAKMVLDGRDGT